MVVKQQAEVSNQLDPPSTQQSTCLIIFSCICFCTFGAVWVGWPSALHLPDSLFTNYSTTSTFSLHHASFAITLHPWELPYFYLVTWWALLLSVQWQAFKFTNKAGTLHYAICSHEWKVKMRTAIHLFIHRKTQKSRDLRGCLSFKTIWTNNIPSIHYSIHPSIHQWKDWAALPSRVGISRSWPLY